MKPVTDRSPAPRPLAAPLAAPMRARMTLRAGAFRMEASARATPLGLLAVGGLVAAILLSVPPILRAAPRPHGKALPGD
jgi:hypothetical protein